jgi:hypothetical protein
MNWITFRKQPHVQRLNENQQIRLFNLHLHELDQEDYNHWVKGKQQDENVILQENGFYLLQENGSKINIYA